ncbi:MAG: restriction endonuclease [Lachnospiraceae bacterium]|nr:restriction endonuclease [Lachnospiraceae bacterium]
MSIISSSYIYIVIAVFAIIILTTVIIILYGKRNKYLPMDEMEGHDFEYYCAELLEGMGFVEVEVTKGSGDFGADILAEKDGISYAVQCKCYDKPIGVRAVEEIYAGRDYYDRMVGVVMTNQYFTQPAVDMAKKLNILLWDRDYISANDKEI